MWSISRVFVISLSQSALHFLCASSFAAGSFQIPIPFTLLHVPQPKTAQLSPGMVFYNLLQNLKRSNYSTQTEYSTHFTSYTLSLFRYLEIFMCTVSVTWSSKTLTKTCSSEVRRLSQPVSSTNYATSYSRTYLVVFERMDSSFQARDCNASFSQIFEEKTFGNLSPKEVSLFCENM